MKVGSILVHEWDRHIVLIVAVSKEWKGRDGSTLFDALVLDNGAAWFDPGHMLVLSPAQPYHPFGSVL